MPLDIYSQLTNTLPHVPLYIAIRYQGSIAYQHLMQGFRASAWSCATTVSLCNKRCMVSGASLRSVINQNILRYQVIQSLRSRDMVSTKDVSSHVALSAVRTCMSLNSRVSTCPPYCTTCSFSKVVYALPSERSGRVFCRRTCSKTDSAWRENPGCSITLRLHQMSSKLPNSDKRRKSPRYGYRTRCKWQFHPVRP